MISLASGAFFRRAHTEARDWGNTRIPRCNRPGDAPLIAVATSVVALVAPLIGDVTEAEARSSQAAALIDALPDDQCTRLRRGYPEFSAELSSQTERETSLQFPTPFRGRG
jgi:hypothetical protein